jgi:prepilin-type N-terminal cleavage/methylation domain-containing protein
MTDGQGTTDGGFTLVELMVAMMLMAILFGLALPSISDWRKNLFFRQTARQMTGMLGEARGMAIKENLQHMVVFTPMSSSYQIFQGNQSYNSSYTTIAGLSKLKSPAGVAVRTTSAGTSTSTVYVQFNPNGTAKFAAPGGAASDSNISVNDGTIQKYLITVAPTGRVTLQKK